VGTGGVVQCGVVVMPHIGATVPAIKPLTT